MSLEKMNNLRYVIASDLHIRTTITFYTCNTNGLYGTYT